MSQNSNMSQKSNMSQTQNASLSSYYVSNDFYAKLIQDFTDWSEDEKEITDLAVRDSCRRVLEREARYLEEQKFDNWLDLFAAECAYWIPTSVPIGDPRQEVTIAFDDRRRLEDRVFRLQQASAWSQRPASRTARLVSNIQVFKASDPETVLVRSSFLISEFWGGETRLWSGSCGHHLRQKDNWWEIIAKQVNLIDCDQNLRNPSIVL